MWGREGKANMEETDGERLTVSGSSQERSTWKSGVRSAIHAASQAH